MCRKSRTRWHILSGFQSGSKCYLVFKFKDLMPIVPLPGARGMSAPVWMAFQPLCAHCDVLLQQGFGSLEFLRPEDGQIRSMWAKDSKVISKSFPSHFQVIQSLFVSLINASAAWRQFLSAVIIAAFLAWSWAPVGSLLYLAMKPEEQYEQYEQ